MWEIIANSIIENSKRNLDKQVIWGLGFLLFTHSQKIDRYSIIKLIKSPG